MKYIVKNSEPQEFIDWKALVNENWQPTYKDLTSQLKNTLFNSLKEEQGYLCCYCERKLQNDENGNKYYHIEHLRPQSKFPQLQLDYENLLCSCQCNQKNEDNQCGMSKENWFSEDMITPLQEDCESKFTYTEFGKIKSADENNSAIEKTINQLNLNSKKLTQLRSELIDTFYFWDKDCTEELTETERSKLVINHLVEKENNNGEYNEFYTTIKYLFADLIQ